MDAEKLKTILDDHAKWLHGEGGQCADLSRANLRGADLSRANLRGAKLSGADLRYAKLSEANLSGANLSGAAISIPICRMDFGGWSICITETATSIGCRSHANEDWLAWTSESEEIRRMHKNASAWWATHGDVVKAAIKCVMAKAAKGFEVL